MAYFADLKQSMKDLVLTNHDIDLHVDPTRMYVIVFASILTVGVISTILVV